MANTSSYPPRCFTSEHFVMPISESVCFCCLSQNVPVIDPFLCSHTDFIEIYLKTHHNNTNMLQMCFTCHYMLKKIDAFSKQIYRSYNLLSAADFQLTRPVNNWKLINDFQYTTISEENEQITDVCMEHDNVVSDNVDSPKARASQSMDEDQKSMDIKIKVESLSDLEDDVPLIFRKVKRSKSKRKVKSKVKGNPGSGKKRESLNKMYEGKIVLVTLSQDELVEEREIERQKMSFQKLKFKCDDCIKGFDFELPWKTHMEKFHSENTKPGTIVCEFCKTIFSNKNTYNIHYKRHFRRYVCCECNKRSRDLPSLAYHYNTTHVHRATIPLHYHCTDCDFTTDSDRKYRYHKQKHKAPKLCEICNKSFVTTSSYNFHMNSTHARAPTPSAGYGCTQCARRYTRKSSLHEHARAAHAGARAHCAACARSFASPHSYIVHMRTAAAHVTDDGYRFICNDCGKKYKWRTDLIEHIDWEHLKNYKYRCIECDKAFQSNKSLIRHTKIIHQKLKPPKDKMCDFCGKGFTTLTILRSHIRRHTGERPLRCHLCDATFAHDAALYNHKRLVHKVDRKRDIV